MPGNAALHVRIPQSLKAQLESEAAAAGLALPDYLRKNLGNLQSRGIQVVTGGADGDTITIPMPAAGYSPVQPINPGYPYSTPYGYPPQMMGYPQFPLPQVDAMDQFINEMRKMAVAKLFMEMMKQYNNSGSFTPEAMLAMAQGKNFGKSDEFNMKDMMQYSMMQSQMDREVIRAQQTAEMARAKGDKQGEKSAMDYIMALITASMSQNQNFLQQYTAMNQQANQNQQGLFQMMMGSRNNVDAETRQMQNEWNAKLDTMRTELWNNQSENQRKIYEMQMASISVELERIKNDKGKDFLSQIAELYRMRETSPVYKAAFDAVTGAKNESMLGQLIPQLKEMGLDKIIGGIADTAKNLLIKPRVPPPSVFPAPPGAAFTPPSEIDPSQLSALRIPSMTPSSPVPATSTPPPPPPPNSQQTTIEVVPDASALLSKPEDQIGYNNLNNPALATAEPKTAQPPVVIEEIADDQNVSPPFQVGGSSAPAKIPPPPT